jgi:hypothetical protein
MLGLQLFFKVNWQQIPCYHFHRQLSLAVQSFHGFPDPVFDVFFFFNFSGQRARVLPSQDQGQEGKVN